ncbi:PH domain-containing protein [Nocardioides sp. TRM66260-LWL]|uniref:PH domain-containing protein n=1 Tax=Nocardioides sp. TRM66260-LWL TaxID=2874478 RepID=UPI001CC60F4E|nr:PH domain-containing protein [Nocardioides sp. TRM66260-LWL]MBZ5734683.1 PH domain-containing protein [Nocardioides sp. TRM66260-LWL]
MSGNPYLPDGPGPLDLPDLRWTAPDADGWRRLDPRMTILAGLRAVLAAAVPASPAAVGLLGSGGFWVLALGVLALLLAGVAGTLVWLTTSYRDSPGGLELRRGVLHRRVLTASRERIRSLDQSAPLLHRLLGVAKVTVGTGVDKERLELGAVTHREAARLRAVLFEQTAPAAAAPSADAPPTDAPEPAAPTRTEHPLAAYDWGWLRYAPLNLGRLAVAVGALVTLSQLLPNLGVDEEGAARGAADGVRGWAEQHGVVLLLVVGLVGAVVAWLALSTLAAALQWGGYRLTRRTGDAQPVLHLSAGLLSTRSVSVEERRVRGVRLREALLVRWAGGAELDALATGVEKGTVVLTPAAPRAAVAAIGAATLAGAEPPAAAVHALAVPLTPHGPAARRRAHVRAQWTTLVLLLGALAAAAAPRVADVPTPWRDAVAPGLLALAAVRAVAGVAFARLAYRHLGHAVVGDERRPTHLVAGSGTTARVRTVLELDGVIGWVQRASWFQRRLDLVTLLATTAAGDEKVVVRDVPRPVALRLVHTATPHLVAPFLAPPSEGQDDASPSARSSAISSSYGPTR